MSYIYSDRELKVTRVWSDAVKLDRKIETLANLEAMAAQALADANPSENMPTIYVEAVEAGGYARVFEVSFVATLNEISLDAIEDDINDELIAEIDQEAA